MLQVRSRFGARLVPAKDLLADFLRRRGVVRAVGHERRSGAGFHGQAATGRNFWARTPRFTSARSKSRAPCACPSFNAGIAPDPARPLPGGIQAAVG